MAIDNTFVIKKIQKMEKVYSVFSPLTKMPYVECDQETADDQVYIFDSEERIREFGKAYAEQKIPVAAVQINQDQKQAFFNSLYAMAVNMVVYVDGTGETRIDLDQLAKAPDLDPVKNEAVPAMNPLLTLTVAYFMQELRRQTERDVNKMRDMEEEMIANLVKSKFILALETPQAEDGQQVGNISSDQVRVPLLKTNEGDMYEPIYSSLPEFRKYAGKNVQNLRITTITFQQLLQYLTKDAKGYVMDPGSFNLVLTREKIQEITKNF